MALLVSYCIGGSNHKSIQIQGGKIRLLWMGSGIYSRTCEMEDIIRVIFGKHNLPKKNKKVKINITVNVRVSQWIALRSLSVMSSQENIQLGRDMDD